MRCGRLRLERVNVSYLSGRHVYGSSRKDRQDRLKAYGFICLCRLQSSVFGAEGQRYQTNGDCSHLGVCSLLHATPDCRPLEGNRPRHPFTQGRRLCCWCRWFYQWCGRHMCMPCRLGICPILGDKDARDEVAEFGEDSQRAADVRNLYLDLKRSPHAATQRKRKFTVRLWAPFKPLDMFGDALYECSSPAYVNLCVFVYPYVGICSDRLRTK